MSALPNSLTADGPTASKRVRRSNSKETLADAWKGIVSCDYCNLHWHMDCVDPPLLTLPPLNKKWMCPNHAERVMVCSILFYFTRMHLKWIFQPLKRRVPKNQSTPIEITKPRQFNNGNIEVIHSELPSSTSVKPTVAVDEVLINGRRYRVPERVIVLDFWNKLNKWEEHISRSVPLLQEIQVLICFQGCWQCLRDVISSYFFEFVGWFRWYHSSSSLVHPGTWSISSSTGKRDTNANFPCLTLNSIRCYAICRVHEISTIVVKAFSPKRKLSATLCRPTLNHWNPLLSRTRLEDQGRCDPWFTLFIQHALWPYSSILYAWIQALLVGKSLLYVKLSLRNLHLVSQYLLYGEDGRLKLFRKRVLENSDPGVETITMTLQQLCHHE